MSYDKFQFIRAASAGRVDYITEFLNCADAGTKNNALSAAVERKNLNLVKILLKGGADPNHKDVFKRSVLLQAVMGGNADIVKKLIEAGADVNCKDAFKRPVLFLAAANSNAAVVKELLFSPNINKDCEDFWGRTALDAALSSNASDEVISLLSANPAPKENEDENAQASRKDFLEKAKQGDFQYIKEHLDNIPLDIRKLAFVYTPSVKISELLLSSGVWVDAQDAGERHESVWRETWSYTALTEACRSDNTKKAFWLISKGADVNIPHIHTELVAGMANIDDEDNFSPLMLAVKKSNAVLAARLIEAGADINYKGHRGAKNVMKDKPETAMDIALRVGDAEIIDLLSRAGAPQKEKPVIDEAFFNAAVKGNIDYVKANCHKTSEQTLNAALVYASDIKILDLLFFAGANANAEYALGNSVKFDDGEYYSCWTPLLQACAADNYQKAAWLTEIGADVNIPIVYRNEKGAKYKGGGESALMFAAALASVQTVKLLLEAGADPHYKDYRGTDAFARAVKAEEGRPETPVCNLLREFGDGTGKLFE